MICTSILRLTTCVQNVLWYLCMAETYSLCTHCALGFIHGLYVSAEYYRRVQPVLWDLCMIRKSLLRLTVYEHNVPWDLCMIRTSLLILAVCVHTVLWNLCMIRTSVLRLTAMYIIGSVDIYTWFARQC